ncbi:Peroxidase [Gryllus bimaculatus]|nr:Peroxidase [Gryllus bimaculatus]
MLIPTLHIMNEYNALLYTLGAPERVADGVCVSGVYEPPRALDGGPLPSARLLRRLLLPNAPFKYGDAHVYTLLTMQWGQLLAHDTALTRDFMGANGFSAQCCAINNSTPSHRSPLPANETASTCLPANGPGPYCLSIVRGNASFVTSDGFVGPGEQDDDVNSYIDASFVYGNSDATLAALRANQSGLLATSGNNWLPPSANATVDCDPRNRSDVCFTAGDPRVNQNTQLTALQIVFLREHNRVAGELARVNPQWDDERLFQETRRVIIAVFQHITYSRLVPIYVGAVTANRFNLVPNEFCRYDQNGYQPTVDATTFNEFATASNRVFHGIAQSILKLFGQAGGCPVGKLRLNEWMDTPVAVVQPPERLDQLLLGLSTQPMLKAARWITEALGEHLFETDRDPGQDLGAFDIQRGRDHGLPPYCEYRRKLGGRCCRSWRDLEDYIDPEVHHDWRSNVFKSSSPECGVQVEPIESQPSQEDHRTEKKSSLLSDSVTLLVGGSKATRKL